MAMISDKGRGTHNSTGQIALPSRPALPAPPAPSPASCDLRSPTSLVDETPKKEGGGDASSVAAPSPTSIQSSDAVVVEECDSQTYRFQHKRGPGVPMRPYMGPEAMSHFPNCLIDLIDCWTVPQSQLNTFSNDFVNLVDSSRL